MASLGSIEDNQHNSFKLDSNSEVARRTCAEITNTGANPVPVTFASLTTPEIYNVTSPGTINTEFSQALGAGTKEFTVRVRGSAKLQFAFVSGESGTDFITVPQGTSFTQTGLSLTGVTIYMQVNKVSQDVEILEWT